MPKALWLLVIGMVINVTGSSFLWPLNTIYIHDHLGKSLTVAGFVLMLNSGASVVGNLIGGFLFDKIDGYKSIFLGIIITLSALIGLVIDHGWPTYVMYLTIVGFGTGIVFPAMYAMAGSVWPEGGRNAFNSIFVAQNAGVAIGSALGGLVAAYSFQMIFLANAILYVIFFLVMAFGYRQIKVQPGAKTRLLQPKHTIKNSDNIRALVTLCIGFMLAWVAYSQWLATISAHTQGLGISLGHYSLLWTINGAIIVLGQPIMNKLTSLFVLTVKKQIMIGLCIFIVSFGVVSNAQQFSGFLVAMIILSIGEMLVWPGVPTVANELAPKGREGFYQGFVNSAATGGRMIGPLLGGIFVDLYGIYSLFTLLIGILVISIFTTSIYNRRIKGLGLFRKKIL